MPAPPFETMNRLTVVDVAASTLDPEQKLPISNLIDGNLTSYFATASWQENAWVSLKLRDGASVSFVAIYNRPGKEWQRARLGDYEVWRGSDFGDHAQYSKRSAQSCGESNPGNRPGPFVFHCGFKGDGAYITVLQTGDARELALAEVVVFGESEPPLPPLPPSPPGPPPMEPHPKPPPSPPHPPPLPPPAPSPSLPAPSPPDAASLGPMLTPGKCDALFSMPGGRFRKIWGADGWRVRSPDMSACWFNDGEKFFRDAEAGTTCGRNWYEGNQGDLGSVHGGPTRNWVEPHFTKPAPAVLGFDESIDWMCGNRNLGGWQHAQTCVRSNKNILALFWPAVYNSCANFQWQVCAAKGWLPGQGSPVIKFAYEPRDLNTEEGPHPLGSCNSYAPAGCDENFGYGSSDIFFLEVCIYNTICKNGADVFKLDVGEAFHCELHHEGFVKLKNWLLEPIPGEAVWDAP